VNIVEVLTPQVAARPDAPAIIDRTYDADADAYESVLHGVRQVSPCVIVDLRRGDGVLLSSPCLPSSTSRCSRSSDWASWRLSWIHRAG
jgi:hypothetical protein